MLTLSLEQRCAGEPFVSPEIATVKLSVRECKEARRACAMCHRSSSGSLTRFRSSWAGDSSALRRVLPARRAGLVQDPRAAFEIRFCLGSNSSEQTGRLRHCSIRPDRTTAGLHYGDVARPQATRPDAFNTRASRRLPTFSRSSKSCRLWPYPTAALACNLCFITWLQCTGTPRQSFIGAPVIVGAPMAKGLLAHLD